jgi:hypothetical protein
MEAIPAYSALEENLQQLAELRPLLEKRLLRLTAYFPEPIQLQRGDIPRQGNGAIVVGDVAAATSYRDEHVLRLVAGDRPIPDFEQIDAEERRRFIRGLMKEEGEEFRWLYAQAESLIFGTADPDAYCPHLPNDYQYGIYRKLLQRNSGRIENLNVQVVMEFNSGCATDPEKIKVDELLDIRRDEQVFSSWRELVRNSVNMAEARKQDDVTRLDAFKDEVANRGRDWQANFQKYNKGRLKDVMTVSKEVSTQDMNSPGWILAVAMHDCLCKPIGSKITAIRPRSIASIPTGSTWSDHKSRRRSCSQRGFAHCPMTAHAAEWARDSVRLIARNDISMRSFSYLLPFSR